MAEKFKLLYVDDEPINLDVFRLHFMKTYEVITAGSGQEGLDVLAEHDDLKLVISDMRMPEMNGLEFITSAKENFPHIVCYILTAFDINPEIRTALDNNLINHYFRKPIDKVEINEILEEVQNGNFS